MVYRKLRGVLIVCSVGMMLAGMPSESKACFGWLCPGGCGWSSSRTTYAPPYAPPYAPAYAPSLAQRLFARPAAFAAPAPYAAPVACSPAPVTCCYVPQTCYRTVYENVPVTTCQAVSSCDPCTGCPVTCYRPATTWVRQVRLIPYTTYRIVYSNPCAPRVSYDPCGSGCGAAGWSAASGCGSCAPVASATTPSATSMPAPALTTPGTAPPEASPVPGVTTPAPSTTPGIMSPVPSTTPGPATFKSESGPPPESRLKPVPDAGSGANPVPMPKLIDPDNRSTARPVQHTGYFQLISSPPAGGAAQQLPVDDGGWRASRD